MTRPGLVVLVGAGPGDPELITVRGLRWLRRADVVVCDRLVAWELLAEARADAELIDVGKEAAHHSITQDEINALLVDRAKRGATVVRLKGGDPFVFGRGGEEVDACRDAGIDVVAVSGVSSALAGPAAANVPLTYRSVSRSFAVLTAQLESGEELSDEAVAAACGVDTAVFLMSRSHLGELMQRLMDAGESAVTPAMCVERATTPGQRATVSTVGELAEAVERDGLCAPIVTVIGPTVARAREVVSRHARPLHNKRILITSTASVARRLRRAVRAAGAWPVNMPLIDIEYPAVAADLDEAIARLDRYDWIVFSSVHAVTGFLNRLRAKGADARALHGVKVAAIGCATASALAAHGLIGDLTPGVSTAESLADALCEAKPRHVLYPCSDRARATLPDKLREAGIEVDRVVAYRTIAVKRSPAVIRQAAREADAIVFCSPSAVEQFSAMADIEISGVVACIGPITADASRRAGLSPEVIPHEHNAHALVRALEEYFAGRTAHDQSQHSSP